MAADDSKDEILLAVPSDVSNLKDAIEEGRARCEESGIKTMRITLGIDHAEPKEAWPLELTLQRGQGCPQQLEILGPLCGSAKLGDVQLVAKSPSALRLCNVTCGNVSLDGDGCMLENCQARSIEVSENGAGAVCNCRVMHSRIGLQLRGAVEVDSITISDSVIGISVHGNLDVALRTCQLHRCSAAGLVFHVEMPMDKDAMLTPLLRLDGCSIEDCARDLEVWLHVAGAEALSFDEFPIPSGEHEVVRRGQNWKLKADDGVISWLERPSPEPAERRRKRRKVRQTQETTSFSQTPSFSVGPEKAWACDLLGLDRKQLTLQQLGAAYRRKAREVHPDKQRSSSESTSSFHEVSAAFFFSRSLIH